MVVPLALWQTASPPGFDWDTTASPLIQKLEVTLQKYAAKSTAIADTQVSIGDHGVELAISSTVTDSKGFSRPISVTMLISEATISEGWTSGLLCSAGLIGTSDAKYSTATQQPCGVLTNKAQEVACRALLYSGTYFVSS